MSALRQEISARLDSQRDKLRETAIGMPDRRIGLLQIFRTIDYQCFLNFSTKTPMQDKSLPAQDETWDAQAAENRELFKWGLNEALALFWNEQVDSWGTPLVPTFPMLRDWALVMLQCAGRIRLVEYGLEMERVRLATVSRHSASENAYLFEYAEDAIGVERIEREDANYFRNILERIYKKEGTWVKLSARKNEVTKMMADLVGTWNTHFICYGADPLIDGYYHDLSSAIAPSMHGWDAFPHETRFGGITFLTYINCVRILVGFAIKHVDFCTLLYKKDPSIDLINILSVPSEWDDTCLYMSAALGISIEETRQVLQITVADRENIQHHTAIPAGPYAPHYRIASGSVVRLITGCLDAPFLFMLRELRRKYPSDWDRSVDSREAVFRSELALLLTKYEGVTVFSDNINIRCPQGKTDIDALVMDVKTGVIGIFQLKWQDHFGALMRERESRKTNLLKNGNAWVEKISSWLDEGSLPQLLMSLGVPKVAANNIRETHIFVIGRNFSHFSGTFQPDLRAAWGSWAQVIRAMDGDAEGTSAISILHSLLIKDSPRARAQPPRESQEFEVGDWKWIMHPCRSWSI